MNTISETKLFMLDMDGTFYLGETLLPGAKEFLAFCRKQAIPFTFLTNNSSKNAQSYIAKLAGLGVHIAPEEMFTSGDATLIYLEKNVPDKNIYLVGTKSLQEQYIAAGFTVTAPNPSAVVLGFDTEITYQKLTTLCQLVDKGLPYIATHPDFNCPVDGGFIPDIGAVIAFVEASTGRRPDTIIGKPNKGIAQAVAQRFNLPLESICMVGDRLYTDIALGSCGVRTALVLCGETSRADLTKSPIQPDYLFENLLEITRTLQANTELNGGSQ